MSTLDSSPDRAPTTNPNRSEYHLENHPEDWSILDSLEDKKMGAIAPAQVFIN